jgi:hypothetical protein
VDGRIVSPKLTGIESDEITIMALTRFGGSGGQTHYITGLFPVPDGDRFWVSVNVEYKRATLVVRARNMDVAEAKARAKVMREKRINRAMLSDGIIRRGPIIPERWSSARNQET